MYIYIYVYIYMYIYVYIWDILWDVLWNRKAFITTNMICAVHPPKLAFLKGNNQQSWYVYPFSPKSFFWETHMIFVVPLRKSLPADSQGKSPRVSRGNSICHLGHVAGRQVVRFTVSKLVPWSPPWRLGVPVSPQVIHAGLGIWKRWW